MCLSLSYDNEILSIVFPALSPFLYACHSTWQMSRAPLKISSGMFSCLMTSTAWSSVYGALQLFVSVQ
jgi:hypothetical protein